MIQWVFTLFGFQIALWDLDAERYYKKHFIDILVVLNDSYVNYGTQNYPLKKLQALY